MSIGKFVSKKHLILVAVAVIALAGVAAYFRLSVGSGGGGEPRFVIENVAVGREGAELGEEVPVDVAVANVGNAGGKHRVVLLVDNRREDSKEVRLGPGERSEVSFSFSRSRPDNYRVKVDDTGAGPVRFYVVRPLGPEEPLYRVGWYLKTSPSSHSENAPTKLLVTASASSGIKVELYRIQGGNLVPVESEWWSEAEAGDEELTTVVGRGSPESQTFALIVRGPDRDILYRGSRRYEAGKAEARSFSVYRAPRGEDYEYSIRGIEGEVKGDLPVFVAGARVRVEGEPVDAGLSYRGYVAGGRFPTLLVRSEVEEGPHRVGISFFNEKGEKIDSLKERKVFS